MKKQPTPKFISLSQSDINWDMETQRICQWIADTDARLLYIDLFCGFGGTTAGVERAEYQGKKFALVILGINHDDIALACHKAHNPRTLHLREDIRDVMLEPISKMVRTIREKFPHVKIALWCSAECTHHSKAKGGDSRDADSRSLAEELFRYEEAIQPDFIQVENVTEFRGWGPLEQKMLPLREIRGKRWKHRLKTKYGVLRSKNKKTWADQRGFAFKKDKNKGIVPWMVPVPERKAEYFNEWKNHIISLGYEYQDKNINAADQGAYTARVRYYGQFNRTVPIRWPEQTHAKDTEKHLKQTGRVVQKHKPVRDVLDFDDTGDSIFVPGRIKSDQTFLRLTEGGIKFIAGGKKNYQADRKAYEEWLNGTEAAMQKTADCKDFLIKYNSANPAQKDYKHSIINTDCPAPTIPCRNMIYKPHFEFLTKHFSGHHQSKSYSVDEAAHTITNKDHNALVTAKVLPFIVQYNNNCDFNSVDEPSKVLTKKDKFSLAFIQQRHSGNPSAKVISTNGPARTVTSTGGNQELVQVEKILPYISNYFGNGHNCHNVNNPCPAILAADIHALVQPQPFIYRQFTSGGQSQSINRPAGALMQWPKMAIVSPEWIMDTSFRNTGKSVDEPAKTMLASRKHAYIVNPQFASKGSSIDQPAPVVIARQDKAPMHLAQVEYGTEIYYGIVIYSTDSEAVKELKYFMAIYGIVDIKMRMLKEMELLPIQGFPPDYIEKVRALGIKVSGTNAKKYIGNSQEVTTAKCLVESYAPLLCPGDKQIEKAA